MNNREFLPEFVVVPLSSFGRQTSQVTHSSIGHFFSRLPACLSARNTEESLQSNKKRREVGRKWNGRVPRLWRWTSWEEQRKRTHKRTFRKKKKAQILDLKPNWRVLSAGVIINSPEFINVMDIKVNASHCGLIGRFVECEWGPWSGLPHFSVPFHFWPFPRRKPIGESGWTEAASPQ